MHRIILPPLTAARNLIHARQLFDRAARRLEAAESDFRLAISVDEGGEDISLPVLCDGWLIDWCDPSRSGVGMNLRKIDILSDIAPAGSPAAGGNAEDPSI